MSTCVLLLPGVSQLNAAILIINENDGKRIHIRAHEIVEDVVSNPLKPVGTVLAS